MWGGGYPAYRTTLRKFLWFRTVTGGNAPEFKTITGRIVQFLTQRIAPLKIEASLEPIQSGTGDPSPDNVRPITGHTGADIFVEDEYDAQADPTVQISFGSTVYDGKLTVNEDGTGSVVSEYGLFTMPHDKTWTTENNSYAVYIKFQVLGLSGVKEVPEGTPNRTIVRTSWCKMNALKPSEIGWTSAKSSTDPQFCVSYDNYVLLNFGVLSPTNAQVNQFIEDNNLVLLYPLATPVTIQLSPGQVNALLGNNTVWVDDSDSISVTYQSN